MTDRSLSWRALPAAFCLGLLEAVMLYRLHYVSHYEFVHLEIVNVAVIYAIVVGFAILLMGTLARELRLPAAFVGAGSLGLIPVVLFFRYQKFLRSHEFEGDPLGWTYRGVGLAIVAAATIGLGLLFRRFRRIERLTSGIVVATAVGVFVYNVAVPPAFRAATIAIEGEARRPANVVWVTSDALRADHMSAYGYDRETTPELERFKQDAVFFSDNYAQCCWTQPAMTSLFTALYPFESFQMDGGLSPDLFTVAQVLQSAGWRTAGLSNNEVVGPSTNLDRGFDVFYRPPRRYANDRILGFSTLVYGLDDLVGRSLSREVEVVTVVPQRRFELADRSERGLLQKGLEVLDELGEPLFLYLHFMAPHAPYAAESPWESWGESDLAPTEWLVDDARRMPPKDLAPAAREEIVWRYDREIRMMDAYFGALVDSLRERGLYDDAIVIFTSDHGEEFLEHGEWTHGRGLYQESIRVPLFVKLPGNRLGGQSLALATQGIDVLPTLLELLGIDVSLPYPLRGDPLFRDGGESLNPELGVRPIVIEFNSHYPDVSDQTAVLWERWKLIRHVVGDHTELYDLAADPGERRNVAERETRRRDELATLMEAIIRDHQGGFYRDAPSPLEAQRVQEELRALGYIK